VSDTRQKDVIGCPRCKTAMEEVAGIKPLQKVQGLIAYVCPSCRYTTSKILPARKLRPTGLGSAIDKDRPDHS
jgi:Zn finger protein HypA/HybF involved in hydrogenase expression